MKFILTIKTTNWLPWMITGFLAGFLIVIHARLYQYAFDDAFIHFRVARNLFENGNPYYNANEIVKVSTSSGWTVILAILFAIARLFKIDNNFPLLVSITNALVSLCGMFIYAKVVEILLKKQLSLSEKLLFQIPYLALLLPSSIGLMETPLALLIAGLGIYLLLLSKPSGFALLGVAAYIRLELLILLTLTSLFIVLHKQFRLQHIIGYVALGIIPLLIYDLYFFHTVTPHSIVAKSIVYSIAWSQSAAYVLFYSLPAIPLHDSLVFLSIGTTMLSILLITTVMVFRQQKGLKSFWPLLFCLWSLLVIGGYILGHAFIFDWYTPLYMTPILAACFLCFLSTEYPRNIVVKSLLYVLFLVSAISMARIFYASIFDPGAFSLFESGSRVKVYLNIGTILNDEYPNARLLTSEIGGLGYSFRGKILDAAGLASPDALDFHPMKIPEQRSSGGFGAIPPGYALTYMPDLIVSFDVYAQALLNDEVTRQYNVILIPAYLPDDAIYSESKTIGDSKNLRVYIRKDLPVAEKIYALGQ